MYFYHRIWNSYNYFYLTCREIKAQNGLQIQLVSLDLILKYEPTKNTLKELIWGGVRVYIFICPS